MQSILCSGRFVRPFLDLLARYPELESDVEHLTGQPFEQSLDLERARELIERWVQVTGDVDLGLRAGKATCIGSGGPLDYALHSANTLRESILLAQRYTQLYRYTLEFTTAADGHRALLRLESRIAWPRSLADFALSTAYRSMASRSTSARWTARSQVPIRSYTRHIAATSIRCSTRWLGLKRSRCASAG